MSVERDLQLVHERKQAMLAGNPDTIAKQKADGKLTARERVGLLLDEASFVELDVLAEGAGVVTGYGLVEGRPVYLYAQDFTEHAGAVGKAHARKVIKVMDLAEKTGAPVVALCDSAGANLNDGVHAVNAYAEIMARSAQLSGVVPQIALILGPCAGGAAMSAALSDLVITSKNGQLFVNGPQLVSAATGKQVTGEQIGGAKAQSESGIAQLVAETDQEALALARKLLTVLPLNNLEGSVVDFTANDDMNRLIPALNAADVAADVKPILASVCDGQHFVELGQGHAPEMVTGLGLIGGRTVGIVATQPSEDEGRLSVAGSKKVSRLVNFCDCFNIPLITVVNTQGVKLSGACSQGKLASAAAQLMYAYAQATTAKIALASGNAIGMGYAALASRAVSDMVYAWPSAVISPMGAAAAVQILYEDELAAAQDPIGKRAKLEEKYQNEVADGLNAAAQGYVDDVIEPATTRQMLAAALVMLESKRETGAPKKHGNMPLL